MRATWFICLLSYFVLPLEKSIAGNETIFFKESNSVYTEKTIAIESVTIKPTLYEKQTNKHYKAVGLVVDGFIDRLRSKFSTNGLSYQIEGQGFYSIFLLARRGNNLYAFANLKDLNAGKPHSAVASIVNGNELVFADQLQIRASLVEYRPTVLDKIISWFINMGANVTSSQDWLEFLVIERVS